MNTRIFLLLVVAGLSTARAAGSQINWWSIAGGGGTSTNSDGLILHATLGQAFAGAMAGPGRRHIGGYQGFRVRALAPCWCTLTRTESEPNNTPATANAQSTVRFLTAVGTLTSGDLDYFKFTVASNATAWITVDTGGIQSRSATTRDSILRLLASDGTTVLETDDDDGSGNGGNASPESWLASAIAGRSLPYGDTYVRVQTKSGVLSPYRLLLTVTTGGIVAEGEPNNTAATATPIATLAAPIGVRSGYLETNDVDYYAVTVSGRSLLHVSADADPERDGASHNPVVSLLGRDGSTVYFTANSSSGGQPDPPAEGFGFVVATNGTYYVRVQDAASHIGTYRLMVAACAIQELPTLQSVRTSPGSLSFSWPASAYGFGLEGSPDLRSWIETSGEMTCEDDLIHVSVPALPGDLKQFFRLRGMFPPPP